MPTNLKPAVDRINNAFPWLLQWNDHKACGEFLQRVANEPECKAERVGLLSKDPGENGYTFPNGIRTSHDVIAWPNGERVDIIQSAGGHPAPGGPAWGVIPPDQWRPANKWVDISSWPIFDSGTPHDAGDAAKACEVMMGWFCWMRAWADWPDLCKENEAWIIGEINPTAYRVMLCVEGQSHQQGSDPDVWRDAGVTIEAPQWEDRFKKMLDHVGSQGRKVHATLYGGINYVPTEDDRRRFNDRIVAAAEGRWAAIRSFEVANEYTVNKFTADQVRNAGRDLRSKVPAGTLISLSSPDAAHGSSGTNPTNEEVEASFDVLYGGDGAGANECTIHTMRGDPNNKWADPFSYNFCYPNLKKINNEPPGPGSSAGGMYTNASDVQRDLTNTINAGWAAYVTHCEWSVWNGFLPDCYHNGWREVKYVSQLPQMPEIGKVVKSLGVHPQEEPEVPVPAYDEGWLQDVVRPAVVATYTEANHPLDDLYPTWMCRTLYDYDAGMSKDDSLNKHIGELRAALGLP